MPLNALQVKNFKPREEDYWVTDQKGLRLLVKTNGSKYWRFKYRYQRKQKSLALGVYPDVSLSDARIAVDKARMQLAEGVDPAAAKRQEKYAKYGINADTLEAIAYEWWEIQSGKWSKDHKERVWKRLSDNALSRIGDRPIKSIKPMDIINVIREIEERDALDVSHRVLQDLRRVFRYAVQTGRVDFNPASDLTDILKVRKRKHQPSMPRQELPQFLRELDQYHERGRKLTQLAIKLLVLTFVRPGELRGARWDEFDFEKEEWRIPGERMKMGTDHIVPLSGQALDVLDEIEPITGSYDLVFPSERNWEEPMSDNTMRRAIFKMGFDGTVKGRSKATPHGFRATASSILNEEQFNPDAIERQLSHQERNGVRAAYIHHAQYLEERGKMMQWWADYLDELKSS